MPASRPLREVRTAQSERRRLAVSLQQRISIATRQARGNGPMYDRGQKRFCHVDRNVAPRRGPSRVPRTTVAKRSNSLQRCFVAPCASTRAPDANAPCCANASAPTRSKSAIACDKFSASSRDRPTHDGRERGCAAPARDSTHRSHVIPGQDSMNRQVLRENANCRKARSPP